MKMKTYTICGTVSLPCDLNIKYLLDHIAERANKDIKIDLEAECCIADDRVAGRPDGGRDGSGMMM